VFLIAAIVVAVGFLVFLFLPQIALSTKSGIQARQEGDGQEGDGQDARDRTADGEFEEAVQAVGASAPTSVPPPVGRPGGTRA
jgi:hypothetical protein